MDVIPAVLILFISLNKNFFFAVFSWKQEKVFYRAGLLMLFITYTLHVWFPSGIVYQYLDMVLLSFFHFLILVFFTS